MGQARRLHTGSTRPILGEQINAVCLRTPRKLPTDSIGEGAGIDDAMPGGRLQNLLELRLKRMTVSLCTRLQPRNDIRLEITDKDVYHWKPPPHADEMIALLVGR
jgi:hypothetical protein